MKKIFSTIRNTPTINQKKQNEGVSFSLNYKGYALSMIIAICLFGGCGIYNINRGEKELVAPDELTQNHQTIDSVIITQKKEKKLTIAEQEARERDEALKFLSRVERPYELTSSQSINERVNANSRDAYAIRIQPGKRVSVTVAGDGDTDLDVFIFDSKGNLVDSTNSDECIMQWTTRWSEVFLIMINNNGNVYNQYLLKISLSENH